MDWIPLAALVALGVAMSKKAPAAGLSSGVAKQTATLPSSGSAAGGPCDAAGPLLTYIACLGKLAADKLPALRSQYSKESIRQMVLTLASTYGIPAELLWGAMLQESGARPVGIFAGNVEKAQAKRSSAFGMTQVTRTRYKSEAPLLGQPFNQLPHSALIQPDLALAYMAASYDRGFKQKGGDRSKVPPWAGQWWAGGDINGVGAQRKQNYILTHGPSVWNKQLEA